jgi:hypothetical protein
MEKVYYLRARVEGADPSGARAADFYIVADGQPTAGAFAHDLCREKGWTFAAYLALPQEVPPSEGGAVVIQALQEGYAVVFSALQPGEDE